MNISGTQKLTSKDYLLAAKVLREVQRIEVQRFGRCSSCLADSLQILSIYIPLDFSATCGRQVTSTELFNDLFNGKLY